jgi:hypothetical protein
MTSERREEKMSKKPQVGDRVDVQFAINAKGRFWWFIVPHGVEPLTAVRADPPHGPFASEAEAQANFRGHGARRAVRREGRRHV